MRYDIQNLKHRLLSDISLEVAQSQDQPVLHIVQVGHDLASDKYVKHKQKVGVQLGIKVCLHQFEVSVYPGEIQNYLLQTLKEQPGGVIFQLPLPPEFEYLIRGIPAKQDVDFLGLQQNMLWEKGLLPPTIQAIDLVLRDMLGQSDLQRLNLAGQSVAVIGQGKLVGGPVLRYLKDREATIISINKDTLKAQNMVRLADIVISAAGVPGLVDTSWLKPKALVIDAATSESDGILVGDVLTAEVESNHLLCPSPGGIGPLTVLCLMSNLLKLARLGL